MRMASPTSDGSPIALAMNGNAAAHRMKTIVPATGHQLRGCGASARAIYFSSTLSMEQPLRPDQEHQCHDQIDSHGRQAGAERVGFGGVHDGLEQAGQESAQQ